MPETFVSVLPSASFVFHALGEKSLFPFPQFDSFSGWKNSRKSRIKQKSLLLYMQLSAYSLHLFALPISGPKNPRNSSLKVFFFHQLSPDNSQDDHLSSQREKWAGYGVFLCSAVPWSMGRALLKVSPVSSLIWATVCRLLLGFCSASFHVTRWPTYLSLPIMGHILPYLTLPSQGW